MSSVISSIDYNSKTKITTVVFVNGTSYDYTSVPESIVNEWQQSSSWGTYFNQYIKGQYS